jgi:hypothetical protein
MLRYFVLAYDERDVLRGLSVVEKNTATRSADVGRTNSCDICHSSYANSQNEGA